MTNIIIASDHAGFELKTKILKFLSNFEVLDLGCHSQESVDYPDYAKKLCERINEHNRGILICGSGIGMSIAANRFKHIRAALCTDPLMAKLAREHNNANVLVMGARIIGEQIALACIQEFLHGNFKGEKYKIRLDKL